ncbi:MAG: D-tyrosyl-tRNA(Tyr) deacylase [Fimbriimonadia bacterium]|nr:D-tyrosyl-tRNA(Tyr) deacylase [Fimbriimonadia bacterium]
MKAILQRVSQASVVVDSRAVGAIGSGWLVLLGIHKTDSEADADFLAQKMVHLRAFNDSEGKMNLGLTDVGGQLLVVSNFTLYGDCRKGRRPSFEGAAGYEEGRNLYDYFCRALTALGFEPQTGIYGADMKVSLTNDGPVTLILDSHHR